MQYQIVKPILLLGVLVFMVRSYFTSDAFRRDSFLAHMSAMGQVFVKALCGDKAKVEQDQCADNVQGALFPSFPECSSAMHDMVLCHNLRVGVKIDVDRCHEEYRSAYRCLESRLVPRLQQRGFSSEEISELDALHERDAKKANLGKQKMSKGSGEGVERPSRISGDADVARGNTDSPEVDIVERPRGGEGTDAVEADASGPNIDVETVERQTGGNDNAR